MESGGSSLSCSSFQGQDTTRGVGIGVCVAHPTARKCNVSVLDISFTLQTNSLICYFRNEHSAALKRHAEAPLLTVSESVSTDSYAAFYQSSIATTNSIEAAMSNGLDTVILLQRTVRDLEAKLGVSVRWTQDTEEWKHAMRTKAEEDYDKAIDQLEVQIVSRMFELAKMGQAGTGSFFF